MKWKKIDTNSTSENKKDSQKSHLTFETKLGENRLEKAVRECQGEISQLNHGNATKTNLPQPWKIIKLGTLLVRNGGN